jgi:hypothetical protein
MMRLIPVALFTLIAGLALTGCRDDAPGAQQDPDSTPAVQPGNEPGKLTARLADDDKKWGTLKGQIVWAGGELPEAKELDVTKQQEHCLSKGKIYSEEWIIDKKNKGIRWVYVWLVPDGDDKDAKLAIHPDLEKITVKELTMDQPCCKFIPHSIALRKGQTLVVKNSSPVSHNVDWKGLRPTQGNNVSVPAGSSLKITPKPSIYPINISCGIHPWMHAWLRVFDHPYYFLTGEDGKFEMKNAPAGKCRLMLWHDSGYRNGVQGSKGEVIEIKGGGVTDLGKIEWKPKKD